MTTTTMTDERVRDVPHPWWGDPPDFETAQEWRGVISRQVENVQNDLAFAKVGGRITGEDGVPLRHEDFASWRQERVIKRTKLVRRLQFLNQWIRDNRPTGKIQSEQKPERLKKLIAEDAATRISAMFAAARRFVLLERLYEAADDYVAEDTNESWQALLNALDIVRSHGTSEADDNGIARDESCHEK